MLQLSQLFHGPIPGKLPLSLCPGDLRGIPAGRHRPGLHTAGKKGGHAEADPAPTHLGKANHPVAATTQIALPDLLGTDGIQLLTQIAVVVERVEREVEVGIEDKFHTVILRLRAVTSQRSPVASPSRTRKASWWRATVGQI